MIHNIDPVIFSIGPLDVRYYGLIYMSGFIAGYLFLNYSIVKRKMIANITKEDISDFIFYSVILVVINARLFEVIFYDPSYYFSNPIKILAIHEGGLSFHGGMFGVFLATLHYTKKKKITVRLFGDLIAIPASFSLFVGRIANFLNGELPGIAVENQVNPPWYAVKFISRIRPHFFKIGTGGEKIAAPAGKPFLWLPLDQIPPTEVAKLSWRVPTQILESFKNLVIFIVLIIIFKKMKKHVQGLLIFLFMLMYGSFRFIIEFIKIDYQDRLFGLSMGHLLCIPMIIIGLYGLYYSFYKKKVVLDK